MIVELYAKSDVGRVRRGNEDNFLLLNLSSSLSAVVSEKGDPIPHELERFDLGSRGLVLVVSDGMGGALAGDVASRMAVECVRDELIGANENAADDDDGEDASDSDLIGALREAVLRANDAVHRQSLSDAKFSGMGATFTGAAVSGNYLDLVQVGDSRAYVIRDGHIKLTTKDQSLVQQLIDVGQITEADAETHMFKNVILQALGAQSEITPVTGRVQLCRGDVLLICSDGLSGKLRAEDMYELVSAAANDLGAACDELVREANARGGEDNITVVLARFDGEDMPAACDGVVVEQLRWPGEQTVSSVGDMPEDDITMSPD